MLPQLLKKSPGAAIGIFSAGWANGSRRPWADSDKGCRRDRVRLGSESQSASFREEKTQPMKQGESD